MITELVAMVVEGLFAIATFCSQKVTSFSWTLFKSKYQNCEYSDVIKERGNI